MGELKKFLPYIFAFFLTLLVFWQFFGKGYIPTPGNFMVAWYEPWKTDTAPDGVPTIIHKPVGDDIFRQIIPFKMLAVHIMRTGALPLWNPFGGAGQPLFANLHPGYLNPFSALLLLPKNFGWSLFVILQFPILFLAMYWYMRTLKTSLVASIFSATSLVFSGVVITRLIYGDYIWALITLPILLGLIEQNNKKYLLIGFPIVVFFLLVSVQPQISMYILITVGVYAFIKKVNILFVALLGIGFASVQLVPTFELIRNANVTADSSAFIFQKFLMPFSHLITIIIPNYFGNAGTYNFWGKTDYVETVAAIGSIPVFFAMIGFSRFKFFAWGIGITILLTLDWFGSKLLLPTSISTRIYLLTTFFISVLAGFGFEQSIKKKHLLFFWIGLLGIFITTVALIHGPCPEQVLQCRTVALRTTVIELFIFFMFTVLLFIKQRKLVLLLIIFIGFYNSQKFLPFSPPEYFMPDHAKLAELRSKPFVRTSTNIATDLSSYYGFFDPNYYDPLYIKRYGELVARASDAKISRSDVNVSDNKRLYQLLSIGSDGNPHAYMVHAYEVLQNPLERLFDPTFDASGSAIVEEDPRIAKATNARSLVAVDYYGTTHIRVQTTSDADGLLVVTDNYYPGWNAYVDGAKTKLYRTNYTLRGVVVPKGDHVVEMRYEPLSVQIGSIITMISMIVWVVLLVFIHRKRI